MVPLVVLVILQAVQGKRKMDFVTNRREEIS